MSLLHPHRDRGAHRGGSPAEIRRESEETERINCKLLQAIIKADLQIAGLTAENEALKADRKKLVDHTTRQAAELARLRHALIQARPKVYEVPTRLDRPYAPAAVQLPYPVPVAGRDTSNDTTQPLPILDRPAAIDPAHVPGTAVA
jgi:hypothetical protein